MRWTWSWSWSFSWRRGGAVCSGRCCSRHAGCQRGCRSGSCCRCERGFQRERGCRCERGGGGVRQLGTGCGQRSGRGLQQNRCSYKSRQAHPQISTHENLPERNLLKTRLQKHAQPCFAYTVTSYIPAIVQHPGAKLMPRRRPISRPAAHPAQQARARQGAAARTLKQDTGLCGPVSVQLLAICRLAGTNLTLGMHHRPHQHAQQHQPKHNRPQSDCRKRDHDWRNDDRHQVHHLDHRVQRRAGRVF